MTERLIYVTPSCLPLPEKMSVEVAKRIIQDGKYNPFFELAVERMKEDNAPDNR